MLSNTKVKYIQSLYQKKKRDAEGLFIAEGVKIVNELLTAPNWVIKELFAVSEWVQVNNAGKVPVTVVTEQELGRISAQTTPNQVLAIVQKTAVVTTTAAINGWVVALSGIQDPGNMGTIIRTADWFGVHDIFCSPDCADIFNSKVIQSTMGSFTRVNVNYTNLEEWLARQENIPVYAAVLNGTPVTGSPKNHNGILIIGNESKGISEQLLASCTHRVSIPRKGGAESLNAAVACGILLSNLTG